MRDLQWAELRPGMKVASDVVNYDNQMLMQRGTELTDYLIAKLEYYGILFVKVEDETTELEKEDETGLLQRLETSEEFIRFKKHYEASVEEFRESLNDIVEKNTAVDVDAMYGNVLELVADTSGLNMFDMLQNLRQYDDSTYAHAVNVSLICHILAEWLEFSEEEVKMATICGLLHDIGKVKVPSEIIKKPGKLTDKEYEIIKRHTIEGYQILRGKEMDMEVCNAALMHHEKCDGSGYPLGLVAEQITAYGKLVAIADIYDAMTANRVYRKALSPFEVIQLFEDEGLSRYEPRYILTFLSRVAETYTNAIVQLNDERIGQIIYINKQHIAKPVVRCGDELVDLYQHSGLKIRRIL